MLVSELLDENWRPVVAGATAGALLAFGHPNGFNDPTPQVDSDSIIAPVANVHAPQGPPKPPRIDRKFASAKEALKSVLHTPEAVARFKVLWHQAQAAKMTGTELAQFLAQCAHESLNFKFLEELGSPGRFKRMYGPLGDRKATAKMLGNTEDGDGIKYKGRGYIQITGKHNYQKASEALGIDLVSNPDLAAEPTIAAKIALWYWNTRVAPRVTDFADTRDVTARINPNLHHLDRREQTFQLFDELL